MKNIIKLSLTSMFITFLSIKTFACDALNIEIGTEIKKITNYLNFVNEDEFPDADEEINEKDVTFKYRGMTEMYCPNVGLESTALNIFVYDSKVAGIQLETWDPSKKNKIYEYIKNTYGFVDSEVESDEWLGYKNLSTGGKLIYYSKYKDFGETHEVLDISNEQYVDFTLQEEVEEMFF